MPSGRGRLLMGLSRRARTLDPPDSAVCLNLNAAAAHADDEYVVTAQVHAAARIYLRLALCEAERREAHMWG